MELPPPADSLPYGTAPHGLTSDIMSCSVSEAFITRERSRPAAVSSAVWWQVGMDWWLGVTG